MNIETGRQVTVTLTEKEAQDLGHYFGQLTGNEISRSISNSEQIRRVQIITGKIYAHLFDEGILENEG